MTDLFIPGTVVVILAVLWLIEIFHRRRHERRMLSMEQNHEDTQAILSEDNDE